MDDFKCSVNSCTEIIRVWSEYCDVHHSRAKKYGTPTPLIKCYGCYNEFVWARRAFRSKPYCDSCISTLVEYASYIPKSASVVTSHGISVLQYLKLLVSQDFSCALCMGKFGEDGRRISIDHDHACCKGQYGCHKCIRGLLCFVCNSVVGVIEFYPDVLNNIAIYQKQRVFGDCNG